MVPPADQAPEAKEEGQQERPGAPVEAGVRLLREKGRLTRLMVLRVLASGGPATLRRLADAVEVSPQAVSEHVRRLADEGFVESTDAGTGITPLGRHHLESGLRAIKEYVDEALREGTTIDRTGAVAGEPLAAGEPVALVMREGRLTALPLDAEATDGGQGSRGIAETDAEAGQDVSVRALEGILDLEAGDIRLVVLPDAWHGGSRAVPPERLASAMRGARIVAAQGPVARHVVQRDGLDDGRESVAWGAAEAVVEAAMRGLDCVYLVEAWEAQEAIRRIRAAGARWGLDPRVERVDVHERS